MLNHIRLPRANPTKADSLRKPHHQVPILFCEFHIADFTGMFEYFLKMRRWIEVRPMRDKAKDGSLIILKILAEAMSPSSSSVSCPDVVS